MTLVMTIIYSYHLLSGSDGPMDDGPTGGYGREYRRYDLDDFYFESDILLSIIKLHRKSYILKKQNFFYFAKFSFSWHEN